MVPLCDNVPDKIRDSGIPEDMKSILLWFAENGPKPHNVSFGDSKYSTDMIWLVDPLNKDNEGLSSFISAEFDEEFINVIRERVHVSHDDYQYGCLHSFAYAAPSNTPDYIFSVIKSEIENEDRFLRSIKDKV